MTTAKWLRIGGTKTGEATRKVRTSNVMYGFMRTLLFGLISNASPLIGDAEVMRGIISREAGTLMKGAREVRHGEKIL